MQQHAIASVGPVTVISLAPVEQIRGTEIYIGILEQLGVSVHYLYHENDLLYWKN